MQLSSKSLARHCVVLAGIQPCFQWEDEHNLMDLFVFHPARNCSGGGTGHANEKQYLQAR